jgi:hypothetical protein
LVWIPVGGWHEAAEPLGRGGEPSVFTPVVFRQEFCGDAIEQPESDADRNFGRSPPAALQALDQAGTVVEVDDGWTVGALHGPTSLLAPTTR